MIPVGRQALYLLPDRILVFDGTRVGAVGYEQVTLVVGTTQFIEEEAVPSDADVVSSTWRYVNKGGGPDRRFKNNVQLPVVRYAPPEEFALLAREGREMGFWHVESGPLVRSSYHADQNLPAKAT